MPRWREDNVLGRYHCNDKEDCRKMVVEEELLVSVKIGENRFELRKFLRGNARKGDSKAVGTHPPYSRFINPQWPIQPGNMEPTFKLRSCLNLHVAFDLTTTGRNIHSSALPLLLVAGKGTAKLRGKPRLNPSFIRLGRNRSWLGRLSLKERTQFFQRQPPCW